MKGGSSTKYEMNIGHW